MTGARGPRRVPGGIRVAPKLVLLGEWLARMGHATGRRATQQRRTVVNKQVKGMLIAAAVAGSSSSARRWPLKAVPAAKPPR